MKENVKNKTVSTLLKIALVSVLFSLFFALGFNHRVAEDDDAVQYDTMGWNLAKGNGLSLSLSSPYEPTMFREPAYPVFVAIIYKIFGHNIAPVQAFQTIIFSLTCLLVYFLALNIFDKKVAKYAAFATALCPTLANYPSYIASETLFTFLLCLGIFCLTMAIRIKMMRWFFIAGAVFGLCVLTKSIMLLFPIVILFGLLAIFAEKKISLKIPLLYFFVFLVPFLMLVGSWSYRNHSNFGTSQISLRGGAALWEAGQRMDKTTEEMKHDIVYNFSEYLGGKIFPGLTETPRDYILEGGRKARDREAELAKQGSDLVEMDSIMRKEAIEKIKKHPLKFIIYIPIELIKMTAFIYIPTLNEPHIIEKFYKLTGGKTILSSIRGIFRLSAYPFLLLSIVGFISARKSWRDWFFILEIIIYISLIYCMLFAYGRYSVPLIPLYSIFASVGFLKLFKN